MPENTRLRILAVDDDPNVLLVLQLCLEAEGHTVITWNPVDPKHRHPDGPFDLAILDIDYGKDIDGFDVGKTLRRRQPALPLMFYTGHAKNLEYAAKAARMNAHYAVKSGDIRESLASHIAFTLALARKTESDSSLSRLGLRIFDYSDPLTFLKDYYLRKKSFNRNFSYQRFANNIGINSNTHLFEIINGRCQLTVTTLNKIAAGLEMTPAEAAHFSAIAAKNQTPRQTPKRSRAIHAVN